MVFETEFSFSQFERKSMRKSVDAFFKWNEFGSVVNNRRYFVFLDVIGALSIRNTFAAVFFKQTSVKAAKYCVANANILAYT